MKSRIKETAFKKLKPKNFETGLIGLRQSAACLALLCKAPCCHTSRQQMRNIRAVV